MSTYSSTKGFHHLLVARSSCYKSITWCTEHAKRAQASSEKHMLYPTPGNGCKGCQADCLDSFSCPKYVRRLYRAHATVGPFSVTWCSCSETVFASSVMWPACKFSQCQQMSTKIWRVCDGLWLDSASVGGGLPLRCKTGYRGVGTKQTGDSHRDHVRPSFRTLPCFCNDLSIYWSLRSHRL